jgi:hypothetical protein
MSQDLDSHVVRLDPRLDITDQYIFRDGDATVLIMNVRSSPAGNGAARGFHPQGRYEFKIHLDGHEREDVTFRLRFGATAHGTQSVQLHRLNGPHAADDQADGVLVLDGRTGTVGAAVTGERVWAGRAADPFYLDLALLEEIRTAVARGEKVLADDRRPDRAVNSFDRSTIHAIVLEVPHADSELRLGRRIGLWSTTKLASDGPCWRQVNRIGLPMISLIFRPADSDAAGEANTSHPADDAIRYGKQVIDLVSQVVFAHGSSDHPHAYARALAGRLAPDILPYRVGSAACFGFAEFNGRALADNAPEVMFSMLTNTAVPTGLTWRRTWGSRARSFPYVVPLDERIGAR